MDAVYDWLKGDLSTAGRIWGAVAPALLLGSYFLIGAVVYAIRVAVKGRFHDREVESRGSSALLGMGARNLFAWLMQPLWRGLARFEVPPNAITTLSVLLAAGGGVAVAVGRFSLGGWLYLFAGACDFLDGRLARTTGKATRAGAALDSVLDRYAESAMLVGLAWYYRDSWVLLVVLATLVGSMLVPYIRARGEGLGVDVKVGLMQRPERLVLLGATVTFSPILAAILHPTDPKPMHVLAVVGLCILAATSQLTAVQRLIHVLGKLDPSYSRSARNEGGMLAKNLVSAVAATAVDFVIVLMLVKVVALPAWVATAFGCIVGGIVNFTMNRVWTFQSDGPPVTQAWKYTFVSASSALLNSGGVALLALLPALDFRLAWAIVRVAVFVAWNYPLHRDYVFTEDDPEGAVEPLSTI